MSDTHTDIGMVNFLNDEDSRILINENFTRVHQTSSRKQISHFSLHHVENFPRLLRIVSLFRQKSFYTLFNPCFQKTRSYVRRHLARVLIAFLFMFNINCLSLR